MRNLRWLLLLLTVNFSAVSLAQGTTATLRGPKAFDNPVQTRLGPLSATDTLWRLAEQVRPDPRLSVYQVMFALYEKNPDAFLDDNFNHLKPGAYLDVPTISEIRAVDPIAAQRKSENDDRLWAEKIRLASLQPKASNEQSAQREDLKNLQKELTEEFGRVEAEQDEALRDIRERMTASMSNVETIVQENTQLKKQLNTVVDELAAVQTQLGKDSEIQLQLQQLLAQQAEILAKQQEQIRKQEEGFNFAQAWQNLASSPAGWLIAGTLPALVLLYFIVMAIRRRGQKTEEMVAAATAAPLADPNYKSPLPPMDDSLDFDESSLINLDDSLLQAGAITASPLDGAPAKAKPAATINLDDDLLDDHFDLGSDLKLDHDLLDDALLDDSSQPKATAAPVEFDANNILSGDDLSSLLASVEAEAPAFEAKTDFDPNNILSGDDLSSLFANLEDDDDLTAPPPATASNEHLVPEQGPASSDTPEDIEIDLPDDLQQMVDDADIDALLNTHQTSNATASKTDDASTGNNSASDDDFDIDSLLDSVQAPAPNNAPVDVTSAAQAADDDFDIDALLSANSAEQGAATSADITTDTPNSEPMSSEDNIDAWLESAQVTPSSPAESILEQSVEGVIDSSELDAFAESLADDVLVPADLLVDEHSPEPAEMDVEALLAAVDQQQFGQTLATSSDTEVPAVLSNDTKPADSDALDMDISSMDNRNSAMSMADSEELATLDLMSSPTMAAEMSDEENAVTESTETETTVTALNDADIDVPQIAQPDMVLPEFEAADIHVSDMDVSDLEVIDDEAQDAHLSSSAELTLPIDDGAEPSAMLDLDITDPRADMQHSTPALSDDSASAAQDKNADTQFASMFELDVLDDAPLEPDMPSEMPALADIPVSAEAKQAAMADLQAAEFALDDIQQMLQGVDNSAELTIDPPSAEMHNAAPGTSGVATLHADHPEFAEFDSDFALDATTEPLNNRSVANTTDDTALAQWVDTQTDEHAFDTEQALQSPPESDFLTELDAGLDASLTLDSPTDLSLSASKAPDLQQGDDASVPVLTESQRSVEQPSLMLDEYPELEIADDWLTDEGALAALLDAEDSAAQEDSVADDSQVAPLVAELAAESATSKATSLPEFSADDVSEPALHASGTDLPETPVIDETSAQDSRASLVAEPFRASKAPITVSDALAALDADNETAAELAAIDALNFDALLAELDDDFDPTAAAKPLLLDDDAFDNIATSATDGIDSVSDQLRAEVTDETVGTSTAAELDAKSEIPDYVHIDKLLAATDDVQQADTTPELDVDVGFADFDQLIEPHEVGDVDAADAGFASKLDLVRAYIEIGDQDNAAALVREISQSDAPASVKADAKKLLSES